MKHEVRGSARVYCACGYDPGGFNRSYQYKMLDIHWRNPDTLSNHLEIAAELVREIAAHPSITQRLAQAIEHLVECIEELDRRVSGLEIQEEP